MKDDEKQNFKQLSKIRQRVKNIKDVKKGKKINQKKIKFKLSKNGELKIIRDKEFDPDNVEKIDIERMRLNMRGKRKRPKSTENQKDIKDQPRFPIEIFNLSSNYILKQNTDIINRNVDRIQQSKIQNLINKIQKGKDVLFN